MNVVCTDDALIPSCCRCSIIFWCGHCECLCFSESDDHDITVKYFSNLFRETESCVAVRFPRFVIMAISKLKCILQGSVVTPFNCSEIFNDQGLYSFMVQKISTKFRWDHTQRCAKCRRSLYKLRLSTGRVVSSQANCRRKFVSIRHGGPRPQRCTGGGILHVINNFGGNRSLLITVTVRLTSTRWLYGSLLVTLTAHFSVTCICATEHRMLAVR